MMDRLAVLFCCLAAVAATAIPNAEPQHSQEAVQPAQVAVPAPAAKLVYAEQESPAQYEYEYSVKDPHSGDEKQMKENRAGDEVRGFYAFVQPDGVRRIVEYSSSKEHGFNAVVRYEGQPAPAPARVTYAAQVPVSHATAPAATVSYAPPQASVAHPQAPVHRVAYAPARAAQVYYAPTQPAPVTLNSAQAAPVAYTQARVIYVPAPVTQTTHAAPSPPVSAPVAYVVQPSPAIAPEQRIAFAPASRIAYTQANVAYAAQPQLVHTQAHGAYSSMPLAYAHAPLSKISVASQSAPVSYAAVPVYGQPAQPTGQITYAH